MPTFTFRNLLIQISIIQLLIVTQGISQGNEKGKIAGRVLDAITNEALFGAGVRIAGTNTGATTDFDGKFSIQAESGVVSIEVKLLGYQTQLLNAVKVEKNQTNFITVYLKEQTVDIGAVEIVADAAKNNDNSLLKDQKSNSSIGSGITAELLSKTPDRNLSESFRRISGTSIRDGRFAMVRGLSERYNQGQLNGVSIPSTEPDRKAFALDLFPSELMDRIVVSKSATPDQPGDFAGGLIKIQTLDIPYSNTFSVTLSGEYQSLTTGKSFATIKSSPTDVLGFDNGSRQIPNNIFSKAESVVNPNDQLAALQSTYFNNKVSPVFKTKGPNFSGQISIGRRGKLFGKTAGLVASLSYYRTFTKNEFQNYSPTIQTFDKPFIDYDSVHQDRYKSNTNVAALLNVSIKPTASMKVSLRNFFSQSGVDQVQLGVAKKLTGNATNIEQSKSYISFYEQNSLLSSQFSVEKFFGTGGAKLEGIGGYNLLYRLTPDYSRLFYNRSGNFINGDVFSQPYYATLTDKGSTTFNPGFTGKFFSTLKENSWSGALNYLHPFKIAKIKNEGRAGVYYQTRDRNFDGRNFLYSSGVGSAASTISGLGPDSIFRNENFGGSLLTIRETTTKSDFYSANTKLSAAYLMNETYLGKNGTKIIYGIRYEEYTQSITSTRIGPSEKQRTIVSKVKDWFPSLNANISLGEKLVWRTAISQTVNRPELRELAGFQFYDPNLNASIIGNDTLKRAKIQNLESKIEYYPSPGALFSVNVFSKWFASPIELQRDLNSAFPTFFYVNAYRARNFGLELEARSKFSFIDSLLGTKFGQNLTIFTNLAVIRSNVELKKGLKIERPIQGQSPYVFNAGLQYSHEKSGLDFLITYNRIGPRVAFTAPSYEALIWERPRDIFDLSVIKKLNKFTLKATVGDLFKQELIQYVVFNRGGRKEDQKGFFSKFLSNAPNYQKGQDIPYFRYTFGRTIRLSVSYKI